jgi:hypothetical protein
MAKRKKRIGPYYWRHDRDRIRAQQLRLERALEQANVALDRAHADLRALRRERLVTLAVAGGLLVVLVAVLITRPVGGPHNSVLVVVALPIVIIVGLASVSFAYLVTAESTRTILGKLTASAAVTLAVTLALTLTWSLALHFLLPEEGRAGPEGMPGTNGETGPRGEMIWRNTWNAGRTYAKGDAVRQGGSSYVSLVAGNRDRDPEATLGTAWELFAREGKAGHNGTDGKRGPHGPPGPPGPPRPPEPDKYNPPILPVTR